MDTGTIALALLVLWVLLFYVGGLRAVAKSDRLRAIREREEDEARKQQEQREQWAREREAEEAEWNRRVEVKFGAVYVDGKLDPNRSFFL